MEQVVNNHLEKDSQRVVLTIKYKLYVIVLVLVMALSRGYMQDTAAEYEATSRSVDLLQTQQMQKDREYKEVVNDLLAIKDINTQKAELLTCLSTKGCTAIPETLVPVIPQMRAFLQLQKNEGDKMAFDQKKILANINEYLLKSSTNQLNGVVTSISFGNISTMETIENLIRIPIMMTIEFADKN